MDNYAPLAATAAVAAAIPNDSDEDTATKALTGMVTPTGWETPRPSAHNASMLDERIALKMAHSASPAVPDVVNADVSAKATAIGGRARPARPGVQNVATLDGRIASKVANSVPASDRARAASTGAERAALLDDRIAAASKQRRATTALAVTNDLIGKGAVSVFDDDDDDDHTSKDKYENISSDGMKKNFEHDVSGPATKIASSLHSQGMPDVKKGVFSVDKPLSKAEMDKAETEKREAEKRKVEAEKFLIDEAEKDGLAVAVAINPDEEDDDVLFTAFEYDPDSKPPLYKNRRVRMYSICAICLVIVVVIATVSGVVSRTEKDTVTVYVDGTGVPTSSPTYAPTTVGWTMGVRDQLESLIGPKIYAAGDDPAQLPYKRALDWILDSDPLSLTRESPNIIQRYLLAVLFFSGSNEQKWKYCRPPTDIEDVECEAPVYDIYGNVKVGKFSRFLSGDHECNWFGIKCHGRDNIVREIEIIANNITGTLVPELSKLPVLQRLSLYFNELTGTIPSEYGSIDHLIDLELHTNYLTGTISEDIYNAENIIRLDLGFNALTGTISTNIGQLRSIAGFYVNHNAIEGTIPKEIGNLSGLSYTWWRNNFIIGSIPTEIGQLTNIVDLDLRDNLLTGSLPGEIGRMRRLERLMINNNELGGSIPTQLYNLEELSYFFGYSNTFTGTISSLVGSLRKLEFLILRENSFTGTVPSELADLQGMTKLWLHYNNFTGTVSDNFCEMYDEHLSSFYTDCLNEGGQSPLISCDCCSDCCDRMRICKKNG